MVLFSFFFLPSLSYAPYTSFYNRMYLSFSELFTCFMLLILCILPSSFCLCAFCFSFCLLIVQFSYSFFTKMSDTHVTIRVRKFLRNALMDRRQMIIDVIHPGRASVSKAELQEKVAQMFKVSDPQRVVVFGFRIQYGGSKSTGFCLIYDSIKSLQKFEPDYRQIRQGLKEAVHTSRKQIKEAKNRGKKVWGLGRRAARHRAKKAAA